MDKLRLRVRYCFRKEHSLQYVILLGNDWLELFENLCHWIRKL